MTLFSNLVTDYGHSSVSGFVKQILDTMRVSEIVCLKVCGTNLNLYESLHETSHIS